MSDEPVEDPPLPPEEEPPKDEEDAPLYHPEAAAVAQVVVERSARNAPITREQATYTLHKLAGLITEAYKDSCYKLDHRVLKALRVTYERGERCTDAACPGRHA